VASASEATRLACKSDPSTLSAHENGSTFAHES
jgi:hypothetical protein